MGVLTWKHLSVGALAAHVLLLCSFVHRVQLQRQTSSDKKQGAKCIGAIVLFGTELSCSIVAFMCLTLHPSFNHNQGTFGWIKLVQLSCSVVGAMRYGLSVPPTDAFERDCFYVCWLCVWLKIGAFVCAALASRAHVPDRVYRKCSENEDHSDVIRNVGE